MERDPAVVGLNAALTRAQDVVVEAATAADAVGRLMEVARNLSESTARTSLLHIARDQGETLAQTADHLLQDPGAEP